jgi:hypothetical protein
VYKADPRYSDKATSMFNIDLGAPEVGLCVCALLRIVRPLLVQLCSNGWLAILLHVMHAASL